MKYIIIDESRSGWGDTFTGETNDREQAVRKAKRDWDHLTAAEKKKSRIYVLESVSPDEDAEDHFDGDIVWDADRDA